MHQVRPPAVAGAFYPGQAPVLAHDVRAMLATARRTLDVATQSPKAIIVPHAGYIYSGSTAAMAYARLAGGRNTIRRVVLLGPVHRVPVRGLALPGVGSFATPLGVIEVDQAAIAALAPLPQMVVSQAAHALEHSLEGSSLETIRYMVASGAGVAVMPSTAADPLITKEPMVKVLPFAGVQPQRTVGLVWRVTFPRPQAIDAVRAALLSCQLPGASAAR